MTDLILRVTYKNCSSLNRNLRSHSAPHKCPLTISKCPLSVLWRCPSYREFGYSKMTKKRPGPTPGVRLIEVSVKRELTVYSNLQGVLFLAFSTCDVFAFKIAGVWCTNSVRKKMA